MSHISASGPADDPAAPGDHPPAPGESARQANLLGTASLLVADRLRAATESGVPPGADAPAALVALHTFLGGATIDALSRVLALSHSGTVRLIDRLAQAGLVERRPNPDGRAVALHLTAGGTRAARRAMAAREAVAGAALEPLDPAERAELARLLEKLLAGLVEDHAAARRCCRLCDVDACGHPDRCPVTQALLDRH